MKKAFLLLCALLLALGSALPLAGYRLARAVLSRRAAVPPAPASSTSAASEAAPAAFEGDADVFLIEDLSTGEVQQVPKRDYLIGAVAAEMPLTWPDEALKAQIVAAHSYALYCRDHASAANGSWLSADPARRQGYLTDAVLHSYWGTDYEANYARLSALADAVLGDVLCYGGAAAGTSYFAISNGRTEASESCTCACFKVNQGAACGPTVTPSTSTASVQGWMRTAAMVTGVPRASVAAASMRGRAQSGNHMPTPPVQAAATAATPARGLSQARQRAAGATEGAESGRVIGYGTPVQADVWMVPLTPAERTSPSATRSEEGQPRGRV